MLEYTDKYWKLIIPAIKKPLIKRYGKQYCKELIVKADAVYKDLLNKAPDIGKDNPMAANMYECLIVFALYEAGNGKISKEDLSDIVNEVFSLKILKIVGLFINLNKRKHLDSFKQKLKYDKQWLDNHPQYQEYSWDFNFDETKDKQGFYYHFTQCPINTFARQEGYLDILPIMCDVDYKTAKLMHANLHREYTIATNGKMCDYLFIPDKVKTK